MNNSTVVNRSLTKALTVILCFLSFSCTADQTGIPDYEHAREIFWSELYPKGGKTLYCGTSFSGQYRQGINIEHVFPMSWVTNALDCGRRKECRTNSQRFNQIEADLHNLFPSRKDVNDARSSMRFGLIKGEKTWSGGCDFEIDRSRRVVEPRPAARGEIARAMFYMKETYGLVIFNKLGQQLQTWNKQDSVSKHEKQRNDLIERLQGTRNMFIDEPGLADILDFN